MIIAMHDKLSYCKDSMYKEFSTTVDTNVYT